MFVMKKAFIISGRQLHHGMQNSVFGSVVKRLISRRKFFHGLTDKGTYGCQDKHMLTHIHIVCNCDSKTNLFVCLYYKSKVNPKHMFIKVCPKYTCLNEKHK